MTGLQDFEKEFNYMPDKEIKPIKGLKNSKLKKFQHGLVPTDDKNRYYYGMNTDQYYGNKDKPEKNRGELIDGNFHPHGKKSDPYYKKQMAANEFKNYFGPRVEANNERSEVE